MDESISLYEALAYLESQWDDASLDCDDDEGDFERAYGGRVIERW